VCAEHARDLAGRIPHARLLELDGDDNIWFAGDGKFKPNNAFELSHAIVNACR
jgi:hypothetical protein